MSIEIRKTQVAVEEIWHEGGPRLDVPLRVATALAYDPRTSSIPPAGRLR